jgi:hypothetical protein
MQAHRGRARRSQAPRPRAKRSCPSPRGGRRSGACHSGAVASNRDSGAIAAPAPQRRRSATRSSDASRVCGASMTQARTGVTLSTVADRSGCRSRPRWDRPPGGGGAPGRTRAACRTGPRNGGDAARALPWQSRRTTLASRKSARSCRGCLELPAARLLRAGALPHLGTARCALSLRRTRFALRTASDAALRPTYGAWTNPL